MNICKIIKIAPDGKPWGEPPSGPYYPWYITFADGTAGQANSKSNPPAYKVGDEVGYEVTGATPRGVPKLKIDRKADPAHCRNTTPRDDNPDLEAARSPHTSIDEADGGAQASADSPRRYASPRQAPQKAQSQPTNTQTAPSGQIHAATACWAVGKAVELVIAGKENDVEATARHLLAIQQRIEQGETNVPF